MAASDAFSELLHALNPYLDDQEPCKFPSFCFLPIELRYKVYEEYFIDDRKSFACTTWWAELERRIGGFSLDKKRVSTPFLPSLCFVNRRLRDEAISFFFSTIEVACTSSTSEKAYICDKLESSRCLSIAKKIRKLVFIDSAT
ncbi:hypothetical protein EK21DRAFT_108706 [Setomelanomma holmii]|uniref:2EXR domain-containing protein n=1 Tax=Setomelanomma holmii TaxID=210430 RepID=A0A9P4HGF4_9PLEO|nr:hypothetical protein EK21DRAFT_108706 [Setomelanomma holmii]